MFDVIQFIVTGLIEWLCDGENFFSKKRKHFLFYSFN